MIKDPNIQYDLLTPFKELFHGTYYEKPSFERIVEVTQVHGDGIEILSAYPQTTLICDALITQIRALPLMIKHADCQAALLYDPETKTIAAVHAGFRGLAKNIYGKTIHAMTSRFNCKPAQILAVISPSLGIDHSEFIHYRSEFPEHLWRHQTRPNYMDLKAIAKEQLLNAGILKEHLEISSVDTFSDPRCHSYRRNKTASRMASLIALKE